MRSNVIRKPPTTTHRPTRVRRDRVGPAELAFAQRAHAGRMI